MRTHHTAALAAAAALLLGLTACNPQSTDTGKPAAPSTPASNSAPDPASSAPAAAKTAALPNMVGKGLQTAQDEAQAAGFAVLKSHDALGRDRLQALDRNWKVCSQTPAAGANVDTGTTVDFGAVKLEESCPAADAPAPKPAGSTMPDFVGQGMKAVRGALPSNASITVKDAVQSRMVLQESNWKVCSQDPKPGTALTGQPLSFKVAKADESCP
ncbi:PASTA domain-containing protein [Streptomyces sp. A0592]|uniref:PASTA domain-containing protein n=1 Tax=Streptomyces sp. A0592 TaxID=2563099 RepID=UPI00109EB589|nr:PASTA domain-containing protein [Streptomyces sp. A0592]THA86803.1 PASTA domain-containing protein [Streptomyces sp. A0592]